MQSSIHIAKKSVFHSNTKHIQLKYHFIRFVLEDELLKLETIHTSQNDANMLTKVVTIEKETELELNFSLVTPFVNMSLGF